jgi:hypothetical protein
MTSLTVHSNRSSSLQSHTNSVADTLSQPDSDHPQARGLGENNEQSMGSLWAKVNSFGRYVFDKGSYAFDKYGAVTSWTGEKLLGPAHSDDQLTRDERTAKKNALISDKALLDNVNNAQKNKKGNIPEKHQSLSPGDIFIKKRGGNNVALQAFYNGVNGIFTDPVSGIQASILKGPSGNIIVAFADNKQSSTDPETTMFSKAMGLFHKHSVNKPDDASKNGVIALVKGLLKYPDKSIRIELTGCGFGAALASYSATHINDSRLSYKKIDAPSGLEAAYVSVSAQLKQLDDATFIQDKQDNEPPPQCWKGNGSLFDQVKINSVGDAVVVGTASFGAGLLFGGPLAAAVSGVRTALSYGLQGLPWYTYTLSRHNAIENNRAQTQPFTDAVLNSSKQLLDIVSYASGIDIDPVMSRELTKGLSALAKSDIPPDLRQYYNGITGIFEDKDKNNKLTIMSDASGAIIIGFAGLGDPSWGSLAKDVAQEFIEFSSDTERYRQVQALMEGMLDIKDKKRGVNVNANLILAGHFRCGGVIQHLLTETKAQQALDDHKITAYVFNSVGMSHATRKQHSEKVWNNVADHTIHVVAENDRVARGWQHPTNGPSSSVVVARVTCVVKDDDPGYFGSHSLAVLKRGLDSENIRE